MKDFLYGLLCLVIGHKWWNLTPEARLEHRTCKRCWRHEVRTPLPGKPWRKSINSVEDHDYEI